MPPDSLENDGVRAYTHSMFQALQKAAGAKRKVFIDWTDIFGEIEDPENQRIEQLLRWVRLYPRRSDIQIRLSQRRTNDAGRALQRSLQALGCTVTTLAC